MSMSIFKNLFGSKKNNNMIATSETTVVPDESVGVKKISLSKGDKVDLTKKNPGLTKVRVGLGWDPISGSGPDIDIDASVICLSGNAVDNLVFFRNKIVYSEAIHHWGIT